MRWVYNLLAGSFDMSKIVQSLPKTINLSEIQILLGTQQCVWVWRFCLEKSKLTLAVKESWVSRFQVNDQIAVKREET